MGPYTPGFGGGMFPTDGLPDYMGGINEALAQNAALGQEPSFGKKFGNFLRNWAGYLGDNLTGNPVYAQQMQQAQERAAQEQWYERKRQDELTDYEAKKGIDAKYSAPDLPGLADEYNWYSQQSPEMQQAIQGYMKIRYPGQFTPPSPVNLPYGATVEGGDSGASGHPHVRNTQDYNALPPGTTYIDPNGVVRTKGGQSSGSSAGGFL